MQFLQCSTYVIVSKISRAKICFALTSGIAHDGILYFFHII